MEDVVGKDGGAEGEDDNDGSSGVVRRVVCGEEDFVEVNVDEASGGKVKKVENDEETNVEGRGEEKEASAEDWLKPSSEEEDGGWLEEEAGKVDNEELVEVGEDGTKVDSLAGKSVPWTWLVVLGAVTRMLVDGAEDSEAW